MANGFPNPTEPSRRRLARPSSAAAAAFSAAAAALLAAGVGIPLSAEEEEAGAKRAGLIFVGSFESPEVARHPEGARLTLLAPYYEWDYGIRSFSREKWEAEGLTWDRIVQISGGIADAAVEAMEIEYIRDEREVIECALVKSEDPFLTSAVLSAEFPARFRDTLGERLQVVMIDRYELCVFPLAGGILQDYGPELADRFSETSFPVSLEVFLVDADGVRVIGEISRER